MLSRLRIQEWLLGLGVVLLFGATFKPWFSVPGRSASGAPIGGDLINDPGPGTGLNVWDLGFTRWFIYLALLCAALLIIAALFGETVHWAVVMGTPTVIFSVISSVGLLARWVWPPGGDPVILGAPPSDVQIQTAFYIAVAGSLLLLIAGWWSLRDEYVPPGYAPAPEPENFVLGRGSIDSAP